MNKGLLYRFYKSFPEGAKIILRFEKNGQIPDLPAV
jgi:hypothetical protein